MILKNFAVFDEYKEWDGKTLSTSSNNNYIGFYKVLSGEHVFIIYLDKGSLCISFDGQTFPLKHVRRYSINGRSSTLVVKRKGLFNRVVVHDSFADESIEGDLTAYEREHSDILLYTYNLTRNKERIERLIQRLKTNNPTDPIRKFDQ